jgi:hypothetical protein
MRGNRYLYKYGSLINQDTIRLAFLMNLKTTDLAPSFKVEKLCICFKGTLPDSPAYM